MNEYGVAGAKAFLGGGSIRAGLSTLAGTRPAEPTVTIQPDGTITSDQPATGAEGETDLTRGSNVLMTPEQAAQRLQQIQDRRPAALSDEAFEAPPAQRGLFDTRGGEAPPAPVAGEQIDLFGGGGVAPAPFVDERQGDLFAPQEPTFQTRITAELLDGLGMPRQSPMYRQLLGKDMADPEQQPQIAALFDRVRTDGTISERTKAGVEGLAMQAFGGMAQQQEMFGPRGGAYPQGRPSTQQNAPGPIENLLPTAPLGAAAAAPVEAPVVETPAPVAPAAQAPAQPVALPTVPAGVTLTADENRLVKQANAIFGLAETDAERASVAAMVQRTIERAAQRSGTPVTPVGAPTAVAAALPAAQPAAGVSSTPVTTGAPSGTQAPKTVEAKTQGQKATTSTPAVSKPATYVAAGSGDASLELKQGDKRFVLTNVGGKPQLVVRDPNSASGPSVFYAEGKQFDSRGNVFSAAELAAMYPELPKPVIAAMQSWLASGGTDTQTLGAKVADAWNAATGTKASTSAVRIASTQTAEQQAADELGLTQALQVANRVKTTGNPLQASVQGAGKVAVPGKASLSVNSLRDIRDALLNPSATVEGIGAKEQAIADAVRAFAKAYYKLSNAGGNMLRGIPSERGTRAENGEMVYKPTKFSKQTPAEQRGQIKAKTGIRVENTMKLLEETRAALAALGTAVNGNAKDVEAIVKLTKDMVQQKLHTQVNDTGINEDFGQDTEQDSVDAAFGKLDTMLSQGWNAAKANMFQGRSDAMFVRQTAIRESKEATAAGESQTPLEKAAKGYAVFGKGESSDGILGVMNYIQTHGTPFERTIAKAVFESMAYQEAPKLVFITEGNPRFDPKKNTIYIQRDASAAVTLHEALHSALQWYVYGNPDAPAVRALKASLKQVVNFKGPLGADAKRVQDLLKALMKDKKELDAVLELVSYGNTLNDFRRALEAMDSTEAPKSFFDAANNVWQSILTAVQKMLGVKPSVAADVIANTFKLLEAAGQKGQKKGKATGSVLEAAIQATDPTTAPTIDAAAQQVGFADATAFANGPGKFKTPTQLVFEIVGLGRVNGKDLPLTASIAKNGAKLANYIRKEVPTLERVIMQFNSNFSNSPATVAAIDNYKFLAQTGHLQMEKIATTIAARPELREPFLDYMDGNTKAFAGIQNASGFKAIADNLKGLMKQYISTLPANSKERRAFESMPFTQYIISPTSISQVAGSTLSAGKIASMIGTKKQTHQSLDEFKQFLDMTDGIVDQDQPLYQIFEDKLGKKGLPAGFISKAQYDKTGVTPSGTAVDAKRVWKFSKYDTDKGNFEFSSSITTRDALKNLKSEDLALALVNTTAALSHAHAATTYFGNLASIGRESGKPTAEAVAFDSVDEINEVFGDRNLELNNVLQVSDEASKSQSLRWQTQRTGTWVQLPQGTTYGALAGKIIPGPVWNAMIDMHDRSPAVNFKSFNELMAFFKQSKTVLNPGTHVTNVLSNVALLILHGIRLGTLKRAAGMYAKFERNPDSMNDADRALMQAFFNSGAVLGQFTNSELKGSVYDRLSESITPTSDQSYIKRMTSMAAFEQTKAKLAGWKDNAVEIYAAEDNVFRFAAFLETAGNVQLRDGSKQLDAKQLEEVGLAARKMFLDYDIDARAIRAARQTFLPFVSWSYAIMPVLGRIAVTKPWAIVNMMASVMLMQAALGGEEDDELRKKGPDYLRERSLFGLGPYMHMRIPFVGDDQNPTYLNVGKYIPFLSLFQPAPGESPFAGQSWLPGFATPGGPLVTLISAMNGYDPFTGKPMHAPTDTEWDKLVTTAKFSYDTMAPPVVTTKFWDQIGDLKDGAKGPTGIEKSSMFLARTLGGIGLYQFNVDEAAFYKSKELKEIKKDYKAAMTKAKREEYRKGYPDYEALDRELDDLRDRMQEALAKARGEE
jgi:hypothetical protein